ncbi:MAG: hypothetical protein U0892_03180 [Pirellulales bacterium]
MPSYLNGLQVLLRSTNRQESRLAFRMRAAAADFRSDMTAAAAAWLDLAGATDESGYPNREHCLMQAAWRIADAPSRKDRMFKLYDCDYVRPSRRHLTKQLSSLDRADRISHNGSH